MKVFFSQSVFLELPGSDQGQTYLFVTNNSNSLRNFRREKSRIVERSEYLARKWGVFFSVNILGYFGDQYL